MSPPQMLDVVSKLEEGHGQEKWQIDGVVTSTLLQRHIYLDDPLSLSPAESNLTTFLSHFQNIEFVYLQSSTSTLIMSLPYPTVYQIEEMFANRLDHNTFHTYLAENPDLTVVGKDFHLAGNHKSAESLHTDMFTRIVDALKKDTIRLQVVRVIGGGESAWASVESVATATTKYGE